MPAPGQGAVAALVVQDLLGGEILIAEVHHTDGTRQGDHYWNRISDGVAVDLTREQFTAPEVVLTTTPVNQPATRSGAERTRAGGGRGGAERGGGKAKAEGYGVGWAGLSFGIWNLEGGLWRILGK